MVWDSEQTQFKLLTDTLSDYAVVMTDVDGIIRSWSRGAERIFGYTEQEILGQHKSVLFTPEDREAGVPEKEMATALAQGRSSDNRWHLRKDGSRFWANGAVVPLFGDDGSHQGFGKIAREETETKLLQEALVSATARLTSGHDGKDLFLAAVAHELQTPLAAIRMGVTLLRSNRTDEAKHAEWCDLIEQQVADVTHLVQDLLDATRVTTGKVKLEKVRVRIRDLMEQAVATVQPALQSHRHRLHTSFPAQDVYLEADPLRLRQVFANLLVNAAKYTDEAGDIWFSAAVEHDTVVVRVRDTGVGISKEMLPRIFEMFTQIEYSFERSRGGLGIGLSLARSLVEMHGGTVDVYSDGPGKGAEFTVRLKLAR